MMVNNGDTIQKVRVHNMNELITMVTIVLFLAACVAAAVYLNEQ